MNDIRARKLVARERARVESMLAEVGVDLRAGGSLQRQQTGEYAEAGGILDTESVALALAADLSAQLAAVRRAEERLADGTYGISVDSGLAIKDERLEAEPLAERTVEEQRDFERAGPRAV